MIAARGRVQLRATARAILTAAQAVMHRAGEHSAIAARRAFKAVEHGSGNLDAAAQSERELRQAV